MQNDFYNYQFYFNNFCDIERLQTLVDDLPELSTDIIASIVIPAYNEGNSTNPKDSNLYRILIFLNEQVTFEKNQIDFAKFDIIIVDNASTDNTSQIANTFLKENSSKLKITTVYEPYKGIIKAKSFGYNLAAYRYFRREKKNIYFNTAQPFFVVAMDADAIEIDPFLFAKILKNLNTHYDAFGGDMIFPPKLDSQLPNAMKVLSIHKNECSVFYNAFGSPTFASISCFKPQSIIAIHAAHISPFSAYHVEDAHMGNKLVGLGGEIGDLDTYVITSPRRLLEDPYKFVTGSAYKDGFHDSRNKDDKKVNDISDDDFEKALIARRYMLIRTHVLLMSLLKTRTLEYNKNEGFFITILGGRTPFKQFLQDVILKADLPIKTALTQLIDKYEKHIYSILYEKGVMDELYDKL